MSIRILILLFGAATTFVEVSAAELPPTGDSPRKLLISPALEPRPALKIQLLPRFIDRRPGNAAPSYAKAMIGKPADAKLDAKVAAWLELDPAEFAKSEVIQEAEAAHFTSVVEELRYAANTEHCDWELPLREQMVFSIRLPEIQEMRRMSNYVALEARVLLARRKFAESAATLAVGYAMARHIAESPTLINALVGHAIAARMDKVALDWSQTPDAPSLFWATTYLPKPLIDMRPALEGEMYSLMLSFPALRLEAQSDAQWKADADRLVGEFKNTAGLLTAGGEDTPPLAHLFDHAVVSAQIAVRRGAIQDFLVRCGREPAAVKAMNDSRLLLEYSALKYEDLRDDMFRWATLPYPEARAGIEAAEQRLKASKDGGSADHEIIPFAAMLLPATAQVSKISARSQRRADVLRVVEALRLYVAGHEGRMPESLTAIEGLPVPTLDAVTGKPLDYKLRGTTALLTLPEERNGEKNSTLTYEIEVRRSR
jgi:hypothetical protein